MTDNAINDREQGLSREFRFALLTILRTLDWSESRAHRKWTARLPMSARTSHSPGMRQMLVMWRETDSGVNYALLPPHMLL